METKKTMKIEVALTNAEISKILLDYVVANNEDFKKIYDPSNVSLVMFEPFPNNEEITCLVMTTKIK